MSQVMPKTLKMEPVAFLFGAQHMRLEQQNNTKWVLNSECHNGVWLYGPKGFEVASWNKQIVNNL